MLLKSTRKIKMANCMLYIFDHNFKKKRKRPGDQGSRMLHWDPKTRVNKYASFPTIVFLESKSLVEIQNFLGEKHNCGDQIRPSVACLVSQAQKDKLSLKQTASTLHCFDSASYNSAKQRHQENSRRHLCLRKDPFSRVESKCCPAAETARGSMTPSVHGWHFLKIAVKFIF